MQRLSTTVIAVVGPGSAACVRSFDPARNVFAVPSTGEGDPSERASRAWQQVVRSRSLFTMHDADPLEPVVEAWTGSFAGAPRGDLEIAVADTLARWRSETIGLPDFYLILEPEELPGSRQDWYLGVLHRAAPHRVLPVGSDHALVRSAVGGLSSGPWWPELSSILDGIELAIPDQLMVTSEETTDADRGLIV